MFYPLRIAFLGLSLALASVSAACGQRPSGSLPKDNDACENIEPQGDVLTWLKSQDQEQLARAFDCAADEAVALELPIGVGRGAGTLYSAWPAWNVLQTSIGGVIWGGKRLYGDEGTRRLINLMTDSNTERYHAEVRLGASIRDRKPVVILDYRGDDSVENLGPPLTPAQALVDKIIHGIRDEIRPIYQSGVPTGVYIGRAHLFREIFRPEALFTGEFGFPVSDEKFDDPNQWVMAASFFLDFR